MYSSHYKSKLKVVEKIPNMIPAERMVAGIDESLPLENLLSLLWLDPFSPLAHEIIQTSHRIKSEIYEHRLFAIVPVYVTSYCSEKCLYCNFRRGNTLQIERVGLSDTQLKQEVGYLVESKGLRNIELVYSSDPTLSVEKICRHIRSVKKILEKEGGGNVGINAEPFTTDEYKQMVDSGIDYTVIWMETYDERIYSQLHPGRGKKSDFTLRLDSYEKMYDAGIKHIGMGVLSGLSDWRMDWSMLILHEQYLSEKYSKPTSILGLARLKPAEGAIIQITDHIPKDQEFLLALALHNIYSPHTFAFVNTRESWEMCEGLARGGGCLFTFNCSTIPGGYYLGNKGYQFPTHSYDSSQFKKAVLKDGYEPIFDWEMDKVMARE